MGVDNHTDTLGDTVTDCKALTSGDAAADADTTADDDGPGPDAHLWAWMDDRRDGSTWEAMQDDSTFPGWL